MQAYSYKGFDRSGKSISGHASVLNLDDLESLLARQDIILTSAKEVKIRESKQAASKTVLRAGAPRIRRRRRKISDAVAAELLGNLATMCKAGVPFVECLDALLAISDKREVLVGIAKVKERIVAGSSLSEAMGYANELFPEIVADMLQVAETGGNLDVALRDSAKYLARSADLRRKVMNAMLYPTMMLVVCGVVVLAMIVFVLPRFGEVFTKMHAEIPPLTRFMLNAGSALNAHPIGWTIFCIFTTFLFVLIVRSERGGYIVGAIISRVPGLGDLVNKLAISRALQAISTLLLSNVALVDALNHGAKVAGNRKLFKALTTAVSMVQQGTTLSAACAQTKAFPSMIHQIIGVGERTGQLAPMLAACAEKMEIETDDRLKSLVAVVEPLMIVVMGVLVGFITVSIVTPIYSTIQNIH